MFKVNEADKYICYRTLGPGIHGRPCLGDKCTACVPIEWKVLIEGDVSNVSGLEDSEWRECRDTREDIGKLKALIKKLLNTLEDYQVVIMEDEDGRV